MADILTFRPRLRPAEPAALPPLSEAEIRAGLEAAAQIAMDAADRIIAILDRMDGDPELEDGAEAEPSLAAPENPGGSQVTWTRGNDADREAEAPEPAIPEVAIEAWPFPWSGRGSVITAASVALMDLFERAG